MKHFNITFKPDGKQILVHSGATLIEAAGQAGIILNTVCGGKGTCGKCLVYLEPDAREVLACQYTVDSDLTVTIPAGSRFFEQRILTESVDTKTQIHPDVYKKYVRADSAVTIFGLAVDLGTTTVVARLILLPNPPSIHRRDSATMWSAESHTLKPLKNPPSCSGP